MPFHTSRNGDIAPCDAPPGKCPLGGSPHYETEEQAEAALEDRMSDSLFTPGDSIRQKSDPSKMKLSELSQAVKDTSDPEALDEGIKRGSNRTHKNMLKNENVSADQLKALRDQSESDEIRKAALNHKNFSPDNMNSDEFAQVALRQTRPGTNLSKGSMLEHDSVNDERLDAYVDLAKKNKRHVNIDAALKNPNNDLSNEAVLRHGSKDWTTSGAAVSSGRLSAEQIENLPEGTVYWGSVDRESNQEALDGYARWGAKQHSTGKDLGNGEYIATRVAQNKNTSPETLDELGNKGLASREVYANPNASEETRERLRKSNPAVARQARIMELEREHGDIRKQIVAESSTRRPYNGAPYSTTSVKLDKEKIEKFRLTPDEVRDIMDSRGYNAGSTYDPERGTFVGKVDSSG